jgi:D-serine deaminase-like pyridoxal phosphate-dependent protein
LAVELSYEQICGALHGERLPCAIVDLDALEANARALFGVARAQGKTLRIATKSVRSVPLLRRLLELGGETAGGLMTFTAAETAFLAREGFDDLLLAYPTLQRQDLDDLASVCAAGRRVCLSVDCARHVEAAAQAGRSLGSELGLAIDLDCSYRPGGRGPHLGVRRSPLRTPAEALALARRIRETPGVRLDGLLAYEAQIAGLTDQSPFTRLTNPFKRLLKRLSRPEVAARRAAVVRALREDGFEPGLVNGGGTGSLGSTSAEAAVTEVTAGSGFLCPHLFDYYRALRLQPAAFFVVQAVRAPSARHVTCHGGGYVASGEAGPDRLPLPYLPRGLRLLGPEGAGEVQTPLRAGRGARLPALGGPVVFRHAKAGELAERFNELLLLRGGRLEGRALTYRGQGQSFL